nr:hypothetical protein [Tanacetum cinerariifolium]
MRTRSRSRSRNNSLQREASPAIVEPLRIEFPFLEDQFQEDTPPESSMADNQTMAELLQAPTEGYEDAFVILEITANNFELKHGLINLENAYRDNIQEYVSQAVAANYNQGNTGFRPQMVANQIQPPGFPPHQDNQNNFNRETILIKTEEEISTSQTLTHLLSIKANLIDLSQGQSTQNQCQNIQNQYQNQMATFTEMISKLVSANTASSSGSGTLPGNTFTNPKEDLKGITTRTGVAYQGPKTPSPSKQETK